MIHGHRIFASARSAAVEQALIRAAKSGAYEAWDRLDPKDRLALVEQALKPSNDLIDEFPLAL
jgi:hypothetical protein